MVDLALPVQEFSHERPIVGMGNFTHEFCAGESMIDPAVVKRKFELWDEVSSDEFLKSSEGGVELALSLLKDKTIMAYALFKYNDVPVKLYPLQDAIMNDTCDRVLFCGSNQSIGKSFCLNVDAATEFFMDHGKNWVGLLVSGSLPQSQYQMDRIKDLLKTANLCLGEKNVFNVSYREENTVDTKTGKKDNTTQLTYTFYKDDNKTPKYKNLLICCPHTSSALGYPADKLWLDEYEFWENCDQKHFLYQVIIPRTFHTDGHIKIYSNPDGKEKMLYKLWNLKKPDGSSAWHRYNFNYWDAPTACQEGFDKKIIGMTRTEIESTILAMFTKAEGAFLGSDDIKAVLCPDLSEKGDTAGYGRECVFFLDVGVVHDQSVLVGGYLVENPDVPEIPLIKVFYIHKYPVGYPIGRVVGIEQVNDKDGWKDYAIDNPSVKEVLSDYSEVIETKLSDGSVKETKYPPLFGFDVTGNAGMLPLFQAVDVEGVDVTFSGKRKWHMYQRLQYYVEQHFLKRALERDENTVRGCSFDYQMGKLTIKKPAKGKRAVNYKQIHHESEDDLDDVCFVAGTPILTIMGDVPIECIKVGSIVKTRQGWRKVISTMSREAKVITRFGITATPDHPFITKDGIKSFKNISASDVLYKWNEKQSIIEEGTITDIQTPKDGTCDAIIGHTEAINHQSHYIEKSGELIMGQSQKIISSIIKTKTRSTIPSQTLSACTDQSMLECTCNQKKERRNLPKQSLSMVFQRQELGTSQKKERNGMWDTGTACGLEEDLSQRNVQSVEMIIGQRQLGNQNSAQSFAKVEEDPKENRNSLNVCSVEDISSQDSTNQNIVTGSVQQITNGKMIVYNFEVENEHEYFAHGFLVHNCDATVGLIHLVENPDLPSLSFDIIDKDGKNIKAREAEETKVKIVGIPDNQYIPSFYDMGELQEFVDRREAERY